MEIIFRSVVRESVKAGQGERPVQATVMPFKRRTSNGDRRGWRGRLRLHRRFFLLHQVCFAPWGRFCALLVWVRVRVYGHPRDNFDGCFGDDIGFCMFSEGQEK